MAKSVKQITVNKFNENIIPGEYVYKLGIQGAPGTTFLINNTNIENKQAHITIGKYGIYELDLSMVGGVITTLVFISNANEKIPIIVDIICEDGTEGGAQH